MPLHNFLENKSNFRTLVGKKKNSICFISQWERNCHLIYLNNMVVLEIFLMKYFNYHPKNYFPFI